MDPSEQSTHTCRSATAPEVRVRELMREGALDLPEPGIGSTDRRLLALAEVGRCDLSVGRLAEAHTDAVAILTERGQPSVPAALYGVWAAERPGASLRCVAKGGRLVLNGTKEFCTGVRLCDRALVTVLPDRGSAPTLVELDLVTLRDHPSVVVDDGRWSSPAFADTSTGSIRFDGVELDIEAAVAADGWYLERPGFWHGALGPAAVWAGGAFGLVDAALARSTKSPHGAAQRGALRADAWNLRQILLGAGREVDDDPTDRTGRARSRALTVRHLVERIATDVLDRFGRAVGPGPMAFDAEVSRRCAELSLYIRQFHAESDLEDLHRSAPGSNGAGDATP